MRLGALYLKQKDYSSARQTLERARELDADLPEAAFSLGLLEARLGNADAAIAQFTKAVELRQDYTEAYMNLGVMHMKQNNVSLAAHYYAEAVAADPANAGAHLYLSDAYARLDSTRKSRIHRDLARQYSREASQ